jgi:histone deacetylase 6
MIDSKKPCKTCNDLRENWLCLSCYEIECSRYINGHMSEHYEKTRHPMVLSFSDISVWCYVCDSYVHNDKLTKIKTLAYESKFSTCNKEA